MPTATGTALYRWGLLLHVLAKLGWDKVGSWGSVRKPRGSGKMPESLVRAAGSV